MTVALADDPDQLDPTLARTLVGRMVFTSICEKLYDIDNNLQVVPQLAASMPTTSPDGKTVTIKLRQGVKFNDGTDFNTHARAVVEHVANRVAVMDLGTLAETARARSCSARPSIPTPRRCCRPRRCRTPRSGGGAG